MAAWCEQARQGARFWRGGGGGQPQHPPVGDNLGPFRLYPDLKLTHPGRYPALK